MRSHQGSKPLHDGAHAHELARAEVEGAPDNPWSDGSCDHAVDGVVDKDPVDEPDPTGQLWRLTAKQTKDHIRNQFLLVLLGWPVRHEEPGIHDRCSVEFMGHASV